MATSTDVLLRRRRLVAARRALRSSGLRHRHPGAVVCTLLLVAVTIVGVLVIRNITDAPPISPFTPFIVLAGLFLRPRAAVVSIAYAFGWAVAASALSPYSRPDVALALLGQVLIAGLMLWMTTSRARIGVVGVLGNSMLVDLRDRILKGAELPPLPDGWAAEAAIDTANGDAFSGDFVLASRSSDGRLFEVAVVDVSGKGRSAGTRSLLLSGAMGGLLGSTPPEEFLPASNGWLLRQQWGDDFATCVHIAVDLETGAFSVGRAGHPPVARHDAGPSRWMAMWGPAGPILGVTPGAGYPRDRGVLRHGDGLLLYTDGVIESRNTSLDDGIDRLLGIADHWSGRAGTPGLAKAACDAARSGDADDRAVVVVWRR